MEYLNATDWRIYHCLGFQKVRIALKRRCKQWGKETDTRGDMEPFAIDIRVPSERQILENPKRRNFLGGGWVDSSEPNVINVYWHRRQCQFTVYSLLQVLEHETLHSILAYLVDLETSIKFDNVHRSSCVWTNEDTLVFVDEFRFRRWTVPPYFEEPTEDLLE